MKKSLFLLTLALFHTTLFADPAPSAPPQTSEQKAQAEQAFKAKLLADLPPGTQQVLDMPYVEGAQPGSVPGSAQTLDLYVPSGPGPFPLVISIHGGGWHGGDKDIGGVATAIKYVPEGFALASLDYRLVQDAPFPAQIMDCNAALIWLRKHATQYHIDPDHVGVIGHSAGAHLTALMAVTGDSHVFSPDPTTSVKIQAAVCWSTPADIDRVRGNWPPGSIFYNSHDPAWGLFPNKVYDTAVADKASPASYVHAGVCPMIIVHGGKDTLVPLPQAQVFANNLKAAGVDVTFHIEPDHAHDTGTPEAQAEALAFFERILKPGK